MYCAPCYLFAGKTSQDKQRSLTAVPVTDPSNIGKLIKSHASSPLHSDSCEAAHNFVEILEGKKKDILSSISKAHDEQVEQNRRILTAIVDTIILCGQQNIAIRGHDEDKSNFVALLKFKAQDNSLLADHLQNCSSRNKYTSPTIQNEIISICGELLKNQIVSACNKAPFFGFIADEATDAATMEQMALVLR